MEYITEPNKIYLTDVMKGLKSLPDECVDMIFTSPPYFRLRQYGAETILGGDIDCEHDFNENNFCVKCNAWLGELGWEPHFNDFVQHLTEIFAECKRVLKPAGSLYINIGDTYNTNGFKSNSKTSKTQEYNQKLVTKYRVKDYPNKCLSLIPHRLAMSLIDNGYILRNTIIWAKRSAVPESVKDRYSKRHEYIFFFTKNEKYYFDLNAIKKPYCSASFMRIKYAMKDTASISGITEERRNKILSNGGANPGDITDFWDLSPSADTVPNSVGHIARFNVGLLKKPILSSCPEEGIVLDPFMGSGTTAIAALKYNRKYIGFEIKEDWHKSAIENIRTYDYDYEEPVSEDDCEPMLPF